ncbi:hypothetical protein BLOT_006838 [Blomia tropicalis]|nr:hypothetical protein BLOT_006838 [Blomia tropicalis]
MIPNVSVGSVLNWIHSSYCQKLNTFNLPLYRHQHISTVNYIISVDLWWSSIVLQKKTPSTTGRTDT